MSLGNKAIEIVMNDRYLWKKILILLLSKIVAFAGDVGFNIEITAVHETTHKMFTTNVLPRKGRKKTQML